MRSILVVPALPRADRPDSAMPKTLAGEADAFAVDLAGIGEFEAEAARASALDWIAAARRTGKPILIRVHPLASGLIDADLDAVMAGPPDGIILPDAVGGRDIQHLGAKLAVREAENGLSDGCTHILALAADSPAALFELGSIARATRRLIGIGRDEALLAERIGVVVDQAPEPLRVARSLCLFAAKAAQAPAFDCAEQGEGEAFAQSCARAARDGFSGKFALTPRQARAINAAFASVRTS
ncbi:aldolase/citrate lyase family protein [Rhodoblastus sp.]|uniref:aldolase/citrate lyase family protein n=1 Tax=Rhodoblastus sp. TaxID=1962975 RepID=UPI0035AF484A